MAQRSPISLPHLHFMAFAPLDAWARLLFAPYAWVPPRHWLRLVLGLFTSALGTVITLPERLLLAPVLAIRARRSRATLAHPPGAVVVLGYFRSGTTHLHYLLSCDPRFRTPRWCETLAPQGFVLSWSFLRVFMIPFIAAKRPQDDVAIGPDWPAEDDFALNNWTLASSLAGRFVVPRLHWHYDRFHALEGLTPGEHARWRRTQWAFLWKLARLARGRALLLKSPSHTARVRELADMLPGVKFVHIARDPDAVLRSNVAMAGRLSLYNLQDPVEEDLASRLQREYADTERRFEEQARALPPGTCARVKYDDLVADPIGQLRRVYTELRLDWTPEFERAAGKYLDTVRDYRPASGSTAAQHPSAISAESRGRSARGIAAAFLAFFVCSVLLVAQAWYFRNRNDWLVWPIGAALGLATIRAARAGSTRLGLWAAALTLLAIPFNSIPVTLASDYLQRPSHHPLPPFMGWGWYHILKASRVGAFSPGNVFWVLMGATTAFRYASRPYPHPPGRG